jgi:NAD(P)-dependent dehydrogenase (short-subunit alcohol dehydrogenase family)
MPNWTAADIPDQTGRTFVVTGANSGIGLEAARELARKGAHVVMACRNTGKGDAAAQTITDEKPTGDVVVEQLDLSDLASVRAFADRAGDVDVLINNAGVMAVPKSQTADGFEMQIGTNHLGHFALTQLLGDRVKDRVVTVSSVGHRMGKIDLDDLNWERRRYSRWPAYGQSKLANLLFTYEGQRRTDAAGSGPAYYAAHPGFSSTNLHHDSGVLKYVTPLGASLFGQSAAMGALPTLLAATGDLAPATYVGPGGLGEQKGYPKVVASNKASRDTAVAAKLWDLSAELTSR